MEQIFNYIVEEKRMPLINPTKNFENLRFRQRVRYLLSSIKKSKIYYLIVDEKFAGYMVLERGGARHSFSSRNDLIVFPIYIKPEYRGFGYSRILLSYIPNNKTVYAVIAPNNIASLKTHIAAGFVFDNYVSYSRFKVWRITEDKNERYLYKRKGITV